MTPTIEGKQPIRVLIVDDFTRVRQELRILLTLAGCIEVVGEASDGSEAARLAEALNPDVVLMDLEMPVTDGFESTSQIKGRLPACRVVALTVHGGDAERQKAFAVGFDGFVVKGAPLGVLLEAIRGASSIAEYRKEIRDGNQDEKDSR